MRSPAGSLVRLGTLPIPAHMVAVVCKRKVAPSDASERMRHAPVTGFERRDTPRLEQGVSRPGARRERNGSLTAVHVYQTVARGRAQRPCGAHRWLPTAAMAVDHAARAPQRPRASTAPNHLLASCSFSPALTGVNPHEESISECVQGGRPRQRGRLERTSGHTNHLFRTVDQSERLTILTRAVLAPPLLAELAVSARVHEDNSLTSIYSRTVTPMLKVCRAPKTHT